MVIVSTIIITSVCLFIFSFTIVNYMHVRMCYSIVSSMNKDVY